MTHSPGPVRAIVPQEIPWRGHDPMELSQEETRTHVAGTFTNAVVPEAVAPLCAVVYHIGLTQAETAALVLAMHALGDVIDWASHTPNCKIRSTTATPKNCALIMESIVGISIGGDLGMSEMGHFPVGAREGDYAEAAAEMLHAPATVSSTRAEGPGPIIWDVVTA